MSNSERALFAYTPYYVTSQLQNHIVLKYFWAGEFWYYQAKTIGKTPAKTELKKKLTIKKEAIAFTRAKMDW